MVADGSWLVVHDAQYDRTSYLPLDKGILGALLHPQKFMGNHTLLKTCFNNFELKLALKKQEHNNVYETMAIDHMDTQYPLCKKSISHAHLTTSWAASSVLDTVA